MICNLIIEARYFIMLILTLYNPFKLRHPSSIFHSLDAIHLPHTVQSQSIVIAIHTPHTPKPIGPSCHQLHKPALYGIPT